MYKIIRFYQQGHHSKVIKTVDTLEEAREHCKDTETSSRTCEETVNLDHTAEYGPWFDGYEEI